MPERLADREQIALGEVHLAAIEVELRIVFLDNLEVDLSVELVLNAREELEKILVRLLVGKRFLGVERHARILPFPHGVLMRLARGKQERIVQPVVVVRRDAHVQELPGIR